ncbi:class I tRNA ligase family protein [Candidatus Nomurabacteria bacterium]|nr:class I tRNA ligase family protein [Candidatus Nomurabacteria bacterium]
MHKKFDAAAIEQKWQQLWEEQKLYEVGQRDTNKEKEYVLVEWPYPSGNLHIGHWHAFAVPDIYVRFQRMQGKQVLYPMGFDAFGLPAENAAIKRDTDPRTWTESNIAHMKNQLKSMGNAFSWDKTTSSTDEDYYKWTQWMFTQFFENDIAFRGKGIVNWCPGCNTVIANEQVLADGTCERSGDVIEKKEMPQWMLRITNYADRLVDDLEKVDWPEHIKEAQRRWIGRSKGAEIDFKLSTGDNVTVFTTRPDTLFGATYMVLAPEHPLLEKNKKQIQNWDEVVRYIVLSTQKNEQDRLDATKEKTGVRLEGITATNPANNEEIPVFIADYVLASYGTGAIMAVPAHDERDFTFAQKYGIAIKSVVAPQKITHSGALLEVKDKPGTFLWQLRDLDAKTNSGKIGLFGGAIENDEDVLSAVVREINEELEIDLRGYDAVGSYTYPSVKSDCYISATHFSDIQSNYVLHEGEAVLELTIEELLERDNLADSLRVLLEALHGKKAFNTDLGVLHNSEEFDGMSSEDAKEAIVKKVGGRMTSTYRLRDWSVGRQRYWGVPIPIVYDPEGKPHAVPKEHLPWTLPSDVDFKPTGEAPLAKSKELKERTEKLFGAGWTPEVETLDTFVDSSWYFLRYIDNENTDALSALEQQKKWMPIDIYFGGAEHTTMHLLYSRFWQKALFDLGLVVDDEPYAKRINRGLILGPDGNKMSKSKGNVIDPDEQVSRVGADSVKMYLAFMGPYGEVANYPWDMGGIAGIRRFLERVNGLHEHFVETENSEVTKALHKTILKLRTDIRLYKFNTAISAMMQFVNLVEKQGLAKKSYEMFLKSLAPFAPHLTEELWHEAGKTNSVHLEEFPVADPSLAIDDVVTIGVQVNGKMRGAIELAPDVSEEEALLAAKGQSSIQKYLVDKNIGKVIYVPGRILNIITSD